MRIVYGCIVCALMGFLVSCNSGGKGGNENTGDSDTIVTVESITEKINNGKREAGLFDARSQLFFLRGEIDNAIKDMEIAISIDSLESEYYLKLAEYYLRDQGKSGKAKDILEKCVRIFPKNIDALLNLANIHLYVRQYDKAIEYLDQVKAIDQHNPHMYFTAGVILLERGDTANAVNNFQTTIEKEPKYYKAHIELARLFSLKKDPIAIQYYHNAIELLPESIEAYYSLGLFYQNTGDFDLANENYDHILTEIDSLVPYVYHNKGYIDFLKMDFSSAVSTFTKVIQMDSNYVEAYLHRGVCYEKLNDFTNARADFKKCLELFPNYPLAVNGLNRLDKK